MTRLTPELVTELFGPTLISCENPNVNGAVENFLEQNVWQKNTKKVYDFVFNIWGSTLSSKFLTGFFVGCKTFALDCSSLEIFFEILKTLRNKQLAFLLRNVLRIFNGFLSGYRGRAKVQAPPLTFYFALKFFPRLRWRWDFHSLLV